MNCQNLRRTWFMFITSLAFSGAPESAFAKKQSLVIAVDGGDGGTIRATKNKVTFTCRAAAGCITADIDPTDPFDADTLPDPDFEVAGWELRDVLDKPLESFPNLNRVTLRQNKDAVKLVVTFRKKPFPLKISIENPEGGSVTGPNGQVCASAIECSFPSVGAGELTNVTANPLDGWEVEKWTLTDILGMAIEFPDLRLISIKQTRDGYRVRIKFRKKLLPILVAVEGGVGGSIVDENKRTCSTVAPCMVQPKAKDQPFRLDSTVVGNYMVEKWTVIDERNNFVVYPDVNSLDLVQKAGGLRILLTLKDYCPGTGPGPNGAKAIRTLNDLIAIKDSPTQKHTLVCNLDLAGVTYPGIPVFNGVLDGGGHTISNISIAGSYYDNIRPRGLIDRAENATIHRLKLKNFNYDASPNYGSGSVGGFVAAGKNIKILDSSISDSSITARANKLGGFIGSVDGVEIRNATFSGTIRSNGGYTGRTGGLLGTAGVAITIANTSFSGNVASGSYTGGFISEGWGSPFNIIDSSVSGTVSTFDIGDQKNTGALAAGMIVVGNGDITIKNSRVSADIIGSVGASGLMTMGRVNVSISRTSVTGSIRTVYDGASQGMLGALDPGGPSGTDSYVTISNSYVNSKQSIPTDAKVGSITGLVSNAPMFNVTIENSYVASAFSQTLMKKTGFIAYGPYHFHLLTISNSFFDSVTTGTPTSVIRLNSTSSGYIVQDTGASTTEAMKLQNTYKGWDFKEIWIMPTDGGYPQLR